MSAAALAVRMFRLCHRRQAAGFMKYKGNGPQRNLFVDCLEELADASNMCDMLMTKLCAWSPYEAPTTLTSDVVLAKDHIIKAMQAMFHGLDYAGKSCTGLLKEPTSTKRVGWTPNPWENGAVADIQDNNETEVGGCHCEHVSGNPTSTTCQVCSCDAQSPHTCACGEDGPEVR